jgi:O-antigen/teichoic acid export membrane protein
MFKAIAKKIQPIWSSTAEDNQSLKNKLLKGAAGSFGLKVSSSGLTFITSILFARFLGTVGLGTYSYAITCANLLGIPATLGIDQLMIREMAIYKSKSEWKLMGGLLRWANLIVLASSIVFAIVAGVIVWNLKINSEPEIVWAVILAMITIPIISLRSLRLGAMKGLHRIVLGQMPDSLFAPILIIAITSACYWLFSDSFNVFWVLIVKIVATLITFFIGSVWLWRSLPEPAKQIKPEYRSRQWLFNALPFMFLGTVQLINSRIDIIMLGEMKDVKAVGIYTVIIGITELTVFIHHAANSVLGPTIAALYSEGKLKQLEKIIRKSIFIVFSISLLIGLTMILLGKYLLLIFGSEFIPGYTAMNIVIVGQIFNALTGPVGLLLNMTGHQNYTAIAVASSAALNIILNFILIPQWGINGAAFATTVSLFVINIINVIFVQKTLNISLYSVFKSHKKIR